MIQILDGGLSTHLETLGATFGNDPLWSARLLLSEKGRILIEQAHSDYIKAGCDILTTATYQAFVPTAKVASPLSETIDFASLFSLGVQVAHSAIAKSGKLNKVKVAASMGSYGAILANGAEFTGDFGGISWNDLVEFHRVRIETVIRTRPDLLAFETVPSVFESSAIVQALEECANKGLSLVPAWISFSCSSSEKSCSGDSVTSCAESVKNCAHIFAVGVNCTKPEYVEGILRAYKEVLGDTENKLLICYPNKGETWDAVGRGWVDSTGVQTDEDYVVYAKSWIAAGASIVGGVEYFPIGTRLVIAFC